MSPIEKMREDISEDWKRTTQMSLRCSTERTGMKIPLMQSPGWTWERFFVVVMALVYTLRVGCQEGFADNIPTVVPCGVALHIVALKAGDDHTTVDPISGGRDCVVTLGTPQILGHVLILQRFPVVSSVRSIFWSRIYNTNFRSRCLTDACMFCYACRLFVISPRGNGQMPR